MKRMRRFGVMALVMLLALVSVVPASAGNKTQITGDCYFLEEPDSPDVRLWYTSDNMLHIRDEIQAFHCNFSDPRLGELIHGEINWDVQEYTDPMWYVVGHDYGRMTWMDADGNVLWEGFRNTFDEPIWIAHGTFVMTGRGANTGMVIKGTVDFDGSREFPLHLEGELSGPGQ